MQTYLLTSRTKAITKNYVGACQLKSIAHLVKEVFTVKKHTVLDSPCINEINLYKINQVLLPLYLPQFILQLIIVIKNKDHLPVY